MKCPHGKCCRLCFGKGKKPLSKEQQKANFQKHARLSYAIAALWKKIAKDWERQAEAIK